MITMEPPPLDENEIQRYNNSKKITSMIQSSFIKRQNAYGKFKPISENMNMMHGVSYEDNSNIKMTGPSYDSKYAEDGRVRMSKNDLSTKQLDERTEYFKSKVENLSQSMSVASVTQKTVEI